MRLRRADPAWAGSRPRTLTSPEVPGPEALQDLERRRLPGAVRAEQREHLADLDREADALDGLDRAVGLPQLVSPRCAVTAFRF